MKILALLQNQWLRNAAAHQRHSDHYFREDRELWRRMRRRSIPYALFAGCLTGKRLRQALGAELCERIVWEETSRIITATPGECPPADMEHIEREIRAEDPRIIVAFGRIAQEALRQLRHREGIRMVLASVIELHAPHPAGRTESVMEQLRRLRRDLEAAETPLLT